MPTDIELAKAFRDAVEVFNTLVEEYLEQHGLVIALGIVETSRAFGILPQIKIVSITRSL